ncbi:hypothetical protein R1flu_014599 [Riccia fluitans]|uniref:Generative cell specific-1/HAP2 domain-containing protein n=1 Tax=Riccia fluitans TaxID=41844 RepID=A0ABD1YGK1_9MARC
MLLHLSVLSAKSGESDTVETYITNVLEGGGESRELLEPYRVTIYKSYIYALYRLEYIQSFDGFPHEVELFAPDCRGGSTEKNPNCGWVYNKAGKPLKDSQGFCCLCMLKNKLPVWLGGDSSSTRSKQDCNDTLSSLLNLLHLTRRGSAHCLRHSAQWKILM